MRVPFLAFGWVLGFVLVACGQNPDGSAVGSGRDGTGESSGSDGGPILSVGGTSNDGMNPPTGGGDPRGEVTKTLPAGFSATDIGGFQRGAAIEKGEASGGTGGGSTSSGNCGNILLGVVRDFLGADEKDGHPDFNADIAGANVTPNLVSKALGSDQKPIYASKCEIGGTLDAKVCPYGPQTTTKANFDQWYVNTESVNAPYLISIWLAPQPNGLFTFQSLHYFPVDGAGFKSEAKGDDEKLHNFGFTTELHTQFLYSGGEKFNFQGDDDVWVFINDKLAVDLGGLHPMQLRSVELDKAADELGIEKGKIYPLDLFHAERHVRASTFRIDTNLSFVDCGTVVPGVVR